MIDRLTRRRFLRSSLAVGAVMAAPFSRAAGANDDVRVAVVGVGSRVKIGGKGAQEIDVFRRMPGVRVVALCDADESHLDREAKKFHDRNERVDTHRDVRRLLEDRGIDAVVNATPNHWHALITIWACQAGKDVFVEKPLSHGLWEGRKMVEAARRYNRVAQCGSNSRAKPGLKEAFDYVRQGNLGKIRVVRGINYKPRRGIGRVAAPPPIPKSLDFNLWAGPAEMTPPRREFLHYDWHWDWATGNGDIGNMGIHYLDGCRCVVDQNELPRGVVAVGGRFGYDDDGETPNTLLMFLDYRPVPILFEVRGLPRGKAFQDERWDRVDQSMDTHCGLRLGVVVHCEGGYLAGNVAYDNDGRRIRQFDGEGTSLRQNFIDVVRSRKTADLKNDLLEGHLSASLFHMANISYRLGKHASPEEIRDRAPAKGDSADALQETAEHLAANGIDLHATPATLGPWLSMDPKKEEFIGPMSQEANGLLRRDYRKPFVVPDEV